ncbi:MAG: hypothetical protein AABO41_07315 [Acidobacteriota bacterium]
MRRLLSVCLLMLCLSLPALAGHTLPGMWCECGPEACICDPGEVPTGQLSHTVPDKSSKGTPVDLGSETLLILGLLLLALRYKA